FVSVFEGHVPDTAIVRSVQRLEVASDDVVALAIETSLGRDYIVSQRAAGNTVSVTTPDGVLQASGALTVISIQNGKVADTFSEDDAPIRFSFTRAVAP